MGNISVPSDVPRVGHRGGQAACPGRPWVPATRGDTTGPREWGHRPLSPRKQRRGAAAPRQEPPRRQRPSPPHRKRPERVPGGPPRVPRAGRGRRAAPPPSPLSPGAREGRAGPASLPGSGGRRRVSGGFPPRPPRPAVALGDASPITARGEPRLRAPLRAGPASPALLPA